jgi:urease accessory protein
MLTLALRCLVISAVLSSPDAFAHNSLSQTLSFSAALQHPLTGLDHLLAMLTVGLWSVSRGGRAVWLWPVTFIGFMLLGFTAAGMGLPVPYVEAAVSSSVVILGLCVALAVKAPAWLGAALVGLFAFFHGHAHGSEVVCPQLVSYAAGLALTTVAIHAAGIGLGRAAERAYGLPALRLAGGLTALGGVALTVALP